MRPIPSIAPVASLGEVEQSQRVGHCTGFPIVILEVLVRLPQMEDVGRSAVHSASLLLEPDMTPVLDSKQGPYDEELTCEEANGPRKLRA